MRHALHEERQDLQRVHAAKSQRRCGYKQRSPRNHCRVKLLHHIALCFFNKHQFPQTGAAVQSGRMQLWALFPLIDQRRQLLSYAGKQSAPPLLLRWRRSIAIAAAAIALAAAAIAAIALAAAAIAAAAIATATALAAALAAALTPAIAAAALSASTLAAAVAAAAIAAIELVQRRSPESEWLDLLRIHVRPMRRQWLWQFRKLRQPRQWLWRPLLYRVNRGLGRDVHECE